tara:strand:+ start:912 stop:1625 length:714 start_codon:yes stop_codon:yes gene_type:complete
MKRYRWIPLFIILSIIHGGSDDDSVLGYFTESTGKILLNQSNQMILGSAALAALAATQVDLKVKSYAQTKGLLPDNISHFGDMYGGNWGHWILLSSILVTSLNDDGEPKLSEKMEFATLAMITNVVVTEGMKRGFGRKRPNGNCCKSFPSGHTSHSFTIATIVNELYGDQIGIAAYCLAALVATSRINDNKHYLSDVIFGAGLGTAVGRGFALSYNNRIKDNIPSPQLLLKIYIPLN